MCKICKTQQPKTEYSPAYSPFWPDKTIDICYKCLDKMVDWDNLNEVDRLLQYCNMAFFPDEWRKLRKREENKAFRKYGNTYYEINYYKYDWSEQNENLVKLAKEGIVDTLFEELRPEKLKQLRVVWGENTTDIELVQLEQNFNASLADFNITKETERALLRKLVRMSLLIDKNLQTNKPDKDLIAMYDKLLAQVTKTIGEKKEKGINSVAQIVAFIERNGFRPTYYSGTPKDEIDFMMKDIQEYLRDLVSSEVNITELYERAAEKKFKKENKELLVVEEEDDEDGE